MRLTADVLLVAEVTRRFGRRFSFDIMIPKGAEYRDVLLGLRARVIEYDWRSSRSELTRNFGIYLRENPPDAIHTYAVPCARAAAALCGIKISLSSRSATDHTRPARGFFARLVYDRMTALTVCHGESVRARFLAEGASEGRSLLLGNTLECRAQRRAPGSQLLASFLPLYEGYGHRTLLRGFARLAKEGSARLLICGNGPLRDELRLLASRLGVGERVEFCPLKMSTVIYNCEPNVLLITSEQRWEFPPELAFGVASVVASDISENRDLLGGLGELYIAGDEWSLADAMRRALYSEAAVRAEISATAVEEQGRIYEELLSGGASRFATAGHATPTR